MRRRTMLWRLGTLTLLALALVSPPGQWAAKRPAAPPPLPPRALPCASNPLLVHCHHWLRKVLPCARLDIVLLGNELWQQFPLNSYGGIEASVETMADGLQALGIPFWVITPGRSQRPAYPFDVLETAVAPNGQGGLVGPYVEQALGILRERRDGTGATPVRVEWAHGNASSAPSVGQRRVVVWGQSDWSQGLAGSAVATVTSHHDGGGPVPSWDRGLPSVGHRFLSMDQRSRWPEQFNRTRIIPHGLGPADFRLCEDGGYFLWVASLDWGWEEKGLGIFVELARRHPQRRFHAYGHAQKRPEVLQRLLAETKGLPNFWYGSALIRGEEHSQAFCGASAFIMPTQPSIGESFGLTVIEALSKGVPVITSTAGAPAEILGVPGRHGLVPGVGAACDTLEEYEEALRAFATRTPQQSARTQAFALQRYSSHVVVDEMLGLTLDLLQGQQGLAC